MRKLFLAVLSGLLLAFSWPEIGVFPILFFAFVPLLVLEDELQNSNENKKGRTIFCLSFLAFFIFNAITTYWVYHATVFGAIAAFIVNAILMATAFYSFHKIKRNIKKNLGYLAFIVVWISFEYLHLNWELSWPWLTLGNGFANATYLVQWYEFTGILGGSLLVLLMNILLFKLSKKKTLKATLLPFSLLILSLLFSYNLIPDIKHEEQLTVLIVQPNIDPYTDKFNVGYKKQLDDFIALAKTELSQETELLVGPETALLEEIWENRIDATYSVRAFRELQKEFPNLNILVGASTYKMFSHGEQKTATAREIHNENIFFDAYNSAVFIPDSSKVLVYHKTKLVPGVEKMPYPNVFDKLAALAVDLGGVSGSLGSENKGHQFVMEDKIITPLICYESIYGDLKKGKTNLIAIITNDGWWKNTAGYRQHFAYARLRAIEQRKTIIRSANTGISGVIDTKGEIVQITKWNEKDCLSSIVSLNNEETFYYKFGDYIGRLSVFVAALLLIVAFVKGRLKK